MTISEFNLSNTHDVIANITSKTKKISAQDLYIIFNTSSIRKLLQLITTGTVTRDNQKLTIDSLILKPEHEELLTQGQSPWIKTVDGFALTTKTISPPHFSANFKTLATPKNDPTMFYAIEFTIDNFVLDFSNSRRNNNDEEIEFENVGMMVFPGKISAEILED